ncbi:MAG: hypothetical protein H7831_13450 [Magnetococcus sp. WYHC-3]
MNPQRTRIPEVTATAWSEPAWPWWQERGMSAMVARFPPGWPEHFVIFFNDIMDTLALDASAGRGLMDRFSHWLSCWQGSYPDPSLLLWMGTACHCRPHLYGRFLAQRSLGDEDCLNRATFPLTRAVCHALLGHPNPMRVRERLWEAEELTEAFFQRYRCRFILPYDGRSTEEIYRMTGHVDDLAAVLGPP